MPIQAPQWTDYLNCPACCREFAPSRSPVSLGCGHTLCRLCLKNLHRKQCPFDQTVISVDLEELVVNTALLQLAGYTPPAQPYHPPCVQALSDQDRHAYDVVVKCLEQLAVYLKYCGNANNVMGSRLSRPMQRKLVTLLQCAMTDEEGRGKAARAARSLGDRTVTELIVQHQNPQQLSANLWAAVRSRGCQFLGPAMQEEVLKLVLLALEDGSALSRKVLVMFVVQRLEPHFPQASKTSIGHVVQLLYRASCFKVSKRVCDSSLMQLKEEFRTYESLRREHDAQIVQIATEAGLRIAPDQWSALLYGDTQHKSHMQSIIDKLQTPQSFAQSVQELFITLQRTGDPAQLIAMSIPLDRLANIDASPDAKSPTWQQLSAIMTSLKEVVSGLVHFLQHQTTGRDANHNAKPMERQPDPPTQQSTMQGLPGRYKVAMCRDAQTRTYCPRGNNCTYAHSEEELERYRRINAAVNNGNYQYLMQPPLATRPIYQHFSVPPPPLPTMEHNYEYNMPSMQQQISPSSRRSMIGVDALDREQPYEHDREKVFDHARDQSYDHGRNQPYEHAREQPYDITQEKSYERARENARELPYDITQEKSFEHAREQARELPYDITREQSYERVRELPYDITREQSYERARDLSRELPYDIAREKSYEHARELARELPYDIAREQSYERARDLTRELPYDIAREKSYEQARELTRELPYDIAREKSYEQARELTRELPYDIAREKSYEQARELTRELPYDIAREKSYEQTRELTRELPYDIAREKSYEQARELTRELPYDITREKSYERARELARELAFDIAREKSYERARDLTRELPYDITREQSYEHVRELTREPYEHPQPNVSAENYIASYATALRHGSENMARVVGQKQGGQHQHQNGTVNAMMPPPGRYYAHYVERSSYPYMQHIDTGRINKEEMPQQYPAMGPIGPVEPAQEYPVLEYPQQQYIDDNGPEMHYDALTFGISVPRPMTVAQPQEQAWSTNNAVKCPQMFKFDEMAKNLPLGMEIGQSIPIGMDMAKNVPIGREIRNNLPIGQASAAMPIGREIRNNMPMGQASAAMPIGLEMGNNIPIGVEMANSLPIGIEMANSLPIGMEMANNMPIGMPQTNGDMVHHGMEPVRMKPKIRTANEKRDDQELEKELKALEKRISTEFSKASDQLDTDAE